MNAKEIKEKIQNIIKDANEDLDIFVSVINTETGDGECYGFGCSGCHVSKIVKIHRTGHYKHSHERIHPEITKSVN